MAYDEDLANRIRELMAGEAGVTEKKMFGGLAFLIGGNMAVAASGQGGLMVRVAPEETDDAGRRSRTRAPFGDARPRDAGLAAGGRRGRPDEAAARAVGEARRGVRALAAAEAVELARMSQENVDKTREFIDAYNRRDFEAATRDFDPDIEWVLPDAPALGLGDRHARASSGSGRGSTRRSTSFSSARRSTWTPAIGWPLGCATTRAARAAASSSTTSCTTR